FRGGRVHVGDGTSVEAMVTGEGRIRALGRAEDLARAYPTAERVDLRGGLMTPGWHDAHVHFSWWALQADRVDLRATGSVDVALARIDAYARTRGGETWLLGGDFDKNEWGRWPTAAELDRVTARPVLLRSH